MYDVATRTLTITVQQQYFGELTLINGAGKNSPTPFLEISLQEWQDVMDSLYGYLLVAEENYSSKKGDIFNLNSEINNEITVKEIAQKMINHWKSEISIIESKGNDFYESSELRLDSSKAKNLLAWNDSVSIDQIIEKIVEWEKAEDEKSSELISFNQINNYFQE